jgi:hypothetical protein
VPEEKIKSEERRATSKERITSKKRGTTKWPPRFTRKRMKVMVGGYREEEGKARR